MENIDGAWNMTIVVPAGEQKSTLTIAVSGDRFTGSFSGNANGDTAEVLDGKVVGDTLTWKMKVKKPIPLTLKAEVKVEGNSMKGTVSVEMVRMSFPLTGTRA